MRKPLLFLFSLLLGCCCTALAQKLALSLEVGLQQNYIPDRTEEGLALVCPPGSGFCSFPLQGDLSYTYKEKPAGYVNALLSYNSSERFQLYHHLGLSLLRFKASTQVVNLRGGGGMEPVCRDADGNTIPCEDDSNENPGTVYSDDRLGNTGLLYLGQELGMRYKVLPRLWVQTGLDISYRLYSQVYLYEYTLIPGGDWSQPPTVEFVTVKDTSGRGFNSVVLGAHAGAAYELTDRIALSLNLQHSFTPLYNHEAFVGKGHERSKSNLLRLGVQYKLKSW